jgi:flagellin-specific chaperone FliS
MAKVFINEREIAPLLNISSLDQILKHVEDVHLPPNSVIRRICVDGHSLAPDAFRADTEEIFRKIEERNTVKIFTGTLSDIAHDSIIEAVAYLDRVEAAIPSLATSFQVSPGHESFKNLRQLYEGFYWLNILLDKLGTNFQINLEDVLIKDKPVRDHLQKFAAIVKQLIDSQEKKDIVLISDLLEYEILPLVSVWKGIFSFILQRVTQAQ